MWPIDDDTREQDSDSGADRDETRETPRRVEVDTAEMLDGDIDW